VFVEKPPLVFKLSSDPTLETRVTSLTPVLLLPLALIELWNRIAAVD